MNMTTIGIDTGYSLIGTDKSLTTVLSETSLEPLIEQLTYDAAIYGTTNKKALKVFLLYQNGRIELDVEFESFFDALNYMKKTREKFSEYSFFFRCSNREEGIKILELDYKFADSGLKNNPSTNPI